MQGLADVVTMEQMNRILWNSSQLAASTDNVEKLAKKYHNLGLDHPRIKAYQIITRNRCAGLMLAYNFSTRLLQVPDVPLGLLHDRLTDVIRHVDLSMTLEEESLRLYLESDEYNGIKVENIPSSELPKAVDMELERKLTSLFDIAHILEAYRKTLVNPGLHQEMAVVDNVHLIANNIVAPRVQQVISPFAMAARSSAPNQPLVHSSPIKVPRTNHKAYNAIGDHYIVVDIEDPAESTPDSSNAQSDDKGPSSSNAAQVDSDTLDVANILMSMSVQPATISNHTKKLLKKMAMQNQKNQKPPAKADCLELQEIKRNQSTYQEQFMKRYGRNFEVKARVYVAKDKYFIYNELTNIARDLVYIETLKLRRYLVKLVRVSNEKISFRPHGVTDVIIEIPTTNFLCGRAFICRDENVVNKVFKCGTSDYGVDE